MKKKNENKIPFVGCIFLEFVVGRPTFGPSIKEKTSSYD